MQAFEYSPAPPGQMGAGESPYWIQFFTIKG